MEFFSFIMLLFFVPILTAVLIAKRGDRIHAFVLSSVYSSIFFIVICLFFWLFGIFPK